MTDLIIPDAMLADLRSHLLSRDTERCAIVYTSRACRRGRTRMLAREIERLADYDYRSRRVDACELTPTTIARIGARARRDRLGVTFVHSHPGAEPPTFSATDDRGELELGAFLRRRCPDALHASMVLSLGGLRARLIAGEDMRVVSVGVDHLVQFDPTAEETALEARNDRQVRAFGPEGQRRLSALRVAIVGLGGTGSLMAQQLAHLGVRDFLLFDHDVVDETSLNRLAHAGPSNVGAPKVDVAADAILHVAPDARVERYRADVTRLAAANRLAAVDFLFGCTDSAGSRAVLQQVAYQYLLPCIDMGVVIVQDGNAIRHVHGRVQLLAPGFGCLCCAGLLNPDAVRHDMMTPGQRAADPYFEGQGEPEPAVMPLNATTTSIAAGMFLSMVAGTPMKARHVMFDGVAPSLRRVMTPPSASCPICSASGCVGWGDAWPIGAVNDDLSKEEP
jgi:hypothetical protein